MGLFPPILTAAMHDLAADAEPVMLSGRPWGGRLNPKWWDKWKELQERRGATRAQVKAVIEGAGVPVLTVEEGGVVGC